MSVTAPYLLIQFILLLSSAASATSPDALENVVAKGPVTATTRLRPASPVIGDPLQLELEVVAESGIELLMPEFGEALGRFSIVEFAPSEGVDASGRNVARQRYTLQPRRSGPQSIPPLRIEYADHRAGEAPAPPDADAYELLTERISFDVAAVLPEGAPLEFEPALGTLAPLETADASRWVGWLIALLALCTATPFALRRLRVWRTRERRRSAYELASAALDSLLHGSRPDDLEAMDRFFVELSGIVRRYVEARFAVRSPELTTEEFLATLSESPELLRAQQDLLRGFLRRADLVKFAHVMPAEGDVENSIASARRFLSETRDAESEAAHGLAEQTARA